MDSDGDDSSEPNASRFRGMVRNGFLKSSIDDNNTEGNGKERAVRYGPRAYGIP